MQLGLSPHLSPLLEGNAAQISHHVALLLGWPRWQLAAQFLVVRPQHFRPMTLLCTAAVLMSISRAWGDVSRMWRCSMWGSSLPRWERLMATPGYQLLLAERRLTTGKGAGVIATSHTLELRRQRVAGAAGDARGR